jgi:hypothetical protein
VGRAGWEFRPRKNFAVGKNYPIDSLIRREDSAQGQMLTPEVRMEGWQQKQLGVQRVAPRSAQERNLSTEKNGLTPTGLLMEGQCAHRGAIGLVFRVDCRQTKSWLIVNDKRVDRS